MKKEEAEKALNIMAAADGGCIYCVSELFARFTEEFPEYKGPAQDIFKQRFQKNLFEIETDTHPQL